MNKYIFLLCSLLASALSAQSPSYESVGEKELYGLDVYSLQQDKEGRMWIATDKGLWCYDGYTYQSLKQAELKTKSLFGLTMNQEGDIYCYNLSGQILRVQNDSLEVFFQVPDSLMNNFINIAFDNQNQLVVSGQDYFTVNAAKEVKIIYRASDSKSSLRATTIYSSVDSALYFNLDTSRTIAKFYNNQLEIAPITTTSLERDEKGVLIPLQVLCYEENQVVLAANNSSLIYTKPAGQGYRKFETPQAAYLDKIGGSIFVINNQIWFALANQGVLAFDLKGNPLYGGSRFYAKYRVSAKYVDNNGCVWLGTFGKGLLRIPHLWIQDFGQNKDLKEDEITNITFGEEKEVFAAGLKGEIYRINNENRVEMFYSNEEQKIRSIFYISNKKLLFFDGVLLDRNNKKIARRLSLPSVKDAAMYDADTILVAQHIGVDKIPIDGDDKAVDFQDTYYFGRSYAVSSDTSAKRFLIGTINGAYLIDNENPVQLLVNAESVVAADVLLEGDYSYLASTQGVFVFEDTTLVRHLTKEDGLYSNTVERLVKYQNHLLIITELGLQFYDFLENKFYNISKRDFSFGNKIFDAEIQADLLYLATSEGVVKMNLDSLLKINKKTPKLHWGIVKIGEQILLDFQEEKSLDYTQNKLQVTLKIKDLTSVKKINYYYRLIGLNEDWQIASFEDNEIRYDILPPGTYTFEAYARTDDLQQSPTLSFSFVINKPFWQTTWFVLFSILGFGTLVALFFNNRIRNLKLQNTIVLEKENIEKQLIESRQVALQAQMNPHFLFNALNSIQEMIMLNEKKQAGEYLGKFADLMRMYLQQSSLKEVTLSEELEALSLYLSLEKIRFEEDLNIELIVADTVNQESCYLPPMLIQLYVENAIKHGLLHRADTKSLRIEFAMNKEKDTLLCTIMDNGIGRKKSAIINKNKRKGHQSFSTSATQKRLDLLNYGKTKAIKVQIVDLENDSGTKVCLSIPQETV